MGRRCEALGLAIGGCLLLAGWLPAAAGEDETLEVQDLLERMAQAVQELNYRGIFVYLQNNQLETLHIEHRVEGDRRLERLISLNGSPREVVRDGDKVTCIVPDENAVLVEEHTPRSRFPSLVPMQVAGLADHYDFRAMGRDRVAGRSARLVAIVPRDRFRYGYRLYIDEQTALPLKFDLLGESGLPVEQTMFTQLEVVALSEANVEPPEDPTVNQPEPLPEEHHEQAATQPQRWQFHDLPTGFALRLQELRADSSGAPPLEQYVISDGLASLSVFVEQSDDNEGLRGGSRMGAVSAWGGEVDGHQITVVGEVPPATVRKVMEGVTRAASLEAHR